MNTRTVGSEPKLAKSVRHVEVEQQAIADDGTFPNSKLALLLYHGAVVTTGPDPARIFEQLFAANNWLASWRNGIYPYHHYHSTSHEVLGIYSGSARVQLGGEQGVVCELRADDVVVVPAGVAHKKLSASDDFGVVGAYPEGRDWDMNYGKPGERPRTDRNIAQVPLPRTDPVYGPQGPLVQRWS